MTPQELKNSILQLAIQGNLVEQRPEEGTAQELYAQIQAEKQRLIQSGKLKKEKPLPEITEDEKPFEIPDGWMWVRLGSILNKLTDGAHSTPKYTTNGVPFLSVKDMSSGQLDFSNCRFISELEHQELYSRCNPEYGDLLLTKVGTTGIPVIVDTKQQFSLFVSVALLKFDQTLLYNKFLYNLINSPLVQIQASENTRGVGNKNWVMRDIANTLIVLPPLAEQKRIVAKIEELLPLVDSYEQAWTKLEDFNRRFPEDMKKSILQQAIQGNLVEQRPEEGTAQELYVQIQAEKQRLIKEGKLKKEKPLPEITEGEKPFEIPEGWMWVRFGEIYSLSNGVASRGSKEGAAVLVLRLADLSNNKINVDGVRNIKLTKNEFEAHKLQKGDLIFIRVNGSKERVASPFYYNEDRIISYCDHLFCGHKLTSKIDSKFIVYAFSSPLIRSQLIPEIKTTAGQNTISQASMLKICVPLPPFAEQKRIVDRLEELLPMCERLKQKGV